MSELFELYCLECQRALGTTTNPVMRVICRACFPLAPRPRRRWSKERNKARTLIARDNKTEVSTSVEQKGVVA